MGQNQVIPVTIVAGCCNDQSRFKQTSSVYALGIILNDVMLRNIIYPGYDFALPVAFSAQDGDIHFIGAGFWVRVVKDIMVAMALFAAWSIGIAHEQSLPVYAPGVVGHRLGVTNTAIDRLKIVGMWKSLISCIGVA